MKNLDTYSRGDWKIQAPKYADKAYDLGYPYGLQNRTNIYSARTAASSANLGPAGQVLCQQVLSKPSFLTQTQITSTPKRLQKDVTSGREAGRRGAKE